MAAPATVTVATLGDMDVQVIARPVSVGSASVSATVATGARAIAIGALPDFPSLVAVMVADPAAIADTTPALFTEAIAGPMTTNPPCDR